MKKQLEVGKTYKLKSNPVCVCTYTGDNKGTGFSTSGSWGEGIWMSDASLWELVEPVVVIGHGSKGITKANEAIGNNSVITGEENDPKIRTFDTGANRNSDEGKLDFEGFLSPSVLKKYAEYMHKNRFLENGDIRDSDNWQKGIPVDAYMKSLYRHFFDTWSNHRGIETPETQIQNLCGIMFNSMGMLHELLKLEDNGEEV